MRALGVAVAAFVLAAPALGAGNPAAGKLVFKAKCGSCHTLAAAGTKAKSPNAGPILTGKHETAAKILAEMSGSNTGLMPIFVGALTTKQINDVVAFVVSSTK
jgi:mono/diheme cytochrome c family protein